MISAGGSRVLAKGKWLPAISSALDVTLAEVLGAYGGECFTDSKITKRQFFEAIMNARVDAELADFVVSRCSLPYHRDSRTSIDYGLELGLNWIVEDLVNRSLNNRGLSSSLAGADSSREFLGRSAISTDSDLVVMTQGCSVGIEILVSWSDTWQRDNRLDLRESKFLALAGAQQPKLLCGLEPTSGTSFALLMQSHRQKFAWRENPAWGNKTVYTYVGISRDLRPIREFCDSIIVAISESQH